MGIEGQGNEPADPCGQQPVNALVGKGRPVAHAGQDHVISVIGQCPGQSLGLFFGDGKNRRATADFCVIGPALRRPFAGNPAGNELLQEKGAKPDYLAVGKEIVEKGLDIF